MDSISNTKKLEKMIKDFSSYARLESEENKIADEIMLKLFTTISFDKLDKIMVKLLKKLSPNLLDEFISITKKWKLISKDFLESEEDIFDEDEKGIAKVFEYLSGDRLDKILSECNNLKKNMTEDEKFENILLGEMISKLNKNIEDKANIVEKVDPFATFDQDFGKFLWNTLNSE